MRCLKLFYAPETLAEVALKRSEMSAIGINALSGILLMTTLALCLGEFFTLPLMFSLGLLLGPLIGFCLSSIHARAVYYTGKSLGGNAQFDDLYRLDAWFILLLGVALLLERAVWMWTVPSQPWGVAAVVIPLLVVLFLVLRGYCSCHDALQRFSRTRGAVAITLSLVLFVLAVVFMGILAVSLVRYGIGDDMLSLLTCG